MAQLFGKSYVKVSGAWKLIVGMWEKVTGAWEEFDTLYAKVNGIWKEVFSKDTAPLGVVMLSSVDITNTTMGWNLADGTNGTPTLTDNKYTKISSTPLATGGASTHTHGYKVLNTSSHSHLYSNDQKDPVHQHMTASSHTHSANHTHTGSNNPGYVRLVPYWGGWYLPAGTLLMWPDSSEPDWDISFSSWLATTTWRLMQLGTASSSSLPAEHADTFSGAGGYQSSGLATISRDYGTSTAKYAKHYHTIDHTHAAVSRTESYPPYRGIKYYILNEDIKVVPKGAMFLYTLTGDIPYGYTEQTIYNDLYPMASYTSGTTGGRSKHAVPTGNFNTSYMLSAVRIHGLTENDYYGTYNHYHTFNHSHAEEDMTGDNQPPYRTFRMIRKD